MNLQTTGSRFKRRMSAGVLVMLLGSTAPSLAHAARLDETALDATALSQMEQRADHADPREQCFLYAELLHGLTELAGRQMAAGQDDSAGATMRQVDAVAAKIHDLSAKNTKKLKNAEQLLEHTTHRLADMSRVAQGDERSIMQSALTHLNKLHSDILALVFAR